MQNPKGIESICFNNESPNKYSFFILSTENLVVGKRRKESRYEQQNLSSVFQEEEKPGPSSSKKKKTPFSPTPVKRRNVTGPATSTPRVTKRRKVTEGRIILIQCLCHM